VANAEVMLATQSHQVAWFQLQIWPKVEWLDVVYVKLLDRSASQASWIPLDVSSSNRRPFRAARLAPSIDSGFTQLLLWFWWYA
jgi:hypothetical protein